MAKWSCACGNTIRSSGAIPNPQEWKLISDARFGPLFDTENVTVEQILDASVYAYRCERCDRLHVYWSGLGDYPPTTYIRESD
jgi:hypothetical protein